MDQLDYLDGNRHNTNINQFAPLFESYDEDVNKTSLKPKKTPVISQSENEYADDPKGE